MRRTALLSCASIAVAGALLAGTAATGSDLTFTTTAAGAPPAPTVTIAATPPTVTFGNATAITGQVTGGGAGIKIDLEQTPFPYTDAFKRLASTTTDAAGKYTFLRVAPTVNTKYHVDAKTAPPSISADIVVNVRPKVTLRLSDYTPSFDQRVRFFGSVLPAHDGKAVKIQRRTAGGWKTFATPVLKPATPLNGVPRSRYSRRLLFDVLEGTFRTVFVPADGDHVRGKSRRRHAEAH